MKKTYGRVLLVLASVLTFVSITNGEISNNTSIYDNNLSSYNRTPDAYKVFVDGYHGFYRVYNLNTGEELVGEENEDKTLYIIVGDTVAWNNEDPTESFVVTSEPRLWSNETGSLAPAKKFNYTFNRSGIYDVYIRQRQTFPHQIIIVESLNLTSNRTTIERARDSTINKTIILKKKDNNSTEKSSTKKSNVTIKIYRRNKEAKETSGFEIILTIPIIAIIYIKFTYREKNKKIRK